MVPANKKVRAPQSGRHVDRHFQLSGLVIGTVAVLPFLETLLYNTLVGAGGAPLGIYGYVQITASLLVLWFLMMASFVVEKAAFSIVLRTLAKWLRHFVKSHAKKEDIIVEIGLFLFLAFLLIVFGRVGLAVERLKSFLTDLGYEFVVVISCVGLLLLIGWFLKLVTKGQTRNVEEAVKSWAFGLRLASAFYGLLILVTWKLVKLQGVAGDYRLHFVAGIAKDYILLFIIVHMLCLGLFKIARRECLLPFFKDTKGFLLFVLVCAVIAVLAVWADFNSVNGALPTHEFMKSWQVEYYFVHVHLRDIALLLLPIAGMVFWTLGEIGREMGKQRGGAG
jgi:hypothetical protein